MKDVFTSQEKLIIRFLAGAIIVGVIVGTVRRCADSDQQLTASVDRQIVEFQEAVNSSAKENGTESGTELPAVIGDQDTLLVNINTASKEQLMILPKIGPVTAERIIRYREDFGNFTDLDELKNVKGIGPKTFEQLRALITL